MKRKLPNQLVDLRLLVDVRKRTALHTACDNNRVDIARYLIRKAPAAFLNARDVDGQTALHVAAA